MRWAFWRNWSSRPPEPSRPLPDEVGLPTPPRPPAAPGDRDADDADGSRSRQPTALTSGATPGDAPAPSYAAPLTAPDAADLDRAALAGAGTDVAAAVRAVSGSGQDGPPASRALAVAATGALAARLPVLSGVDDAAVFDEPEDELLHAYADLLVGRAQGGGDADRDDLLAVAHVAAAAAAVDAAGDPALLLLAGVPAEAQLRAAALLLAQTAADGGGSPDRLAAEVREVFAPQG